MLMFIFLAYNMMTLCKSVPRLFMYLMKLIIIE